MSQDFMDLQQRRHQADYDHLADFTRPGAFATITTARQAVDAAAGIAVTPRGQTFFLLVAMQSGLPG